jgi:Putative phage tail protein
MVFSGRNILMASLVLTVVGTVLGGPIGGALGAILGQQVDQRLFAPKGQQGPRLSDLKLQGSSYGTRIPKLFGTVRVAGTVIWATDLRETRRQQSNGKGKPKTTYYTYSSSFAVALSARTISRVGRIWADGKLLRGASGDFKSQTGFRLYTGGEGQTVDPLIASAEGIGNAPAYRGLAYAVFEDFQLADYGNRIPSLSFEVVADEAAVAVGTIFKQLSLLGLEANCPTLLTGFSALGDSVRGVAETIGRAIPISISDTGTSIDVRETGLDAGVIAKADLGTSSDTQRVAAISLDRRSASTVPETLSIAYFDLARDYQDGLQRARRDGGARREERIDLPATLSPAAAKGLAERRLTSYWANRTKAKIRLPWRWLALGPGKIVMIQGTPETWKIVAAALDHMVVELDLERQVSLSSVPLAADPGRATAQADLVHGPTTVQLLDLPRLDDGVAAAPIVVAAASGLSAGWRRAALLVSLDGGNSWSDAGSTAAPAVMGATTTILNPGSALLLDKVNSVDVTLLNAAMQLHDADAASLLAGGNLAMIGNELIQFATAQPLGGAAYRLSGLLRGRRGTENAIGGHTINDRFILIERDTLAALDVPVGAASVRVMAVGIGDTASSPTAIVQSPGFALKPPSPVHLSAMRTVSGDTAISWKRRSRDGWRWIDGVDAPLAEERELYRLTLTPNIGSARSFDALIPSYTYLATDRAADLAAGATVMTIGLVQIGTAQPSPSASLTFSIT